MYDGKVSPTSFSFSCLLPLLPPCLHALHALDLRIIISFFCLSCLFCFNLFSIVLTCVLQFHYYYYHHHHQQLLLHKRWHNYSFHFFLLDVLVIELQHALLSLHLLPHVENDVHEKDQQHHQHQVQDCTMDHMRDCRERGRGRGRGRERGRERERERERERDRERSQTQHLTKKKKNIFFAPGKTKN